MTDKEKVYHYPIPTYVSANSELFENEHALVCFTKIDVSPTYRAKRDSGLSYFANPFMFMWCHRTTGPAAIDKPSWPSVQQIFQSHAKHIQLHVRPAHVFNWIDVGACFLNGITATKGVVDEVYLRLTEKLSEALWFQFGGKPGWSLFVNRQENAANSPDSVVTAVRAVWKLATVDLDLTRYAGDALFAIADEAGRAAVSYRQGQVEFVSRALSPPLASKRTYIFPRSDNYDHEVPIEQVISREEALSIIEAFVLTGSRVGLSRVG